MAVTKAAMYQVMKVRRLTLWPAFIRGNGDSAVIPGAPLVPQAADRLQIDIIRSAAAGARPPSGPPAQSRRRPHGPVGGPPPGLAGSPSWPGPRGARGTAGRSPR